MRGLSRPGGPAIAWGKYMRRTINVKVHFAAQHYRRLQDGDRGPPPAASRRLAGRFRARPRAVFTFR